MASYTFSHSIDIASTDAFATYRTRPARSASPNVDRGNSDFDIRHSFTAGLTYDLALSEGRKRLSKRLLGGWSLDGFVLARSAPPVNVVGASFSAAGVALDARPNVNPRSATGALWAGSILAGKFSIGQLFRSARWAAG